MLALLWPSVATLSFQGTLKGGRLQNSKNTTYYITRKPVKNEKETKKMIF